MFFFLSVLGGTQQAHVSYAIVVSVVHYDTDDEIAIETLIVHCNTI